MLHHNPYETRVRTAPPAAQEEQRPIEFTTRTTTTMGPQSQRRNNLTERTRPPKNKKKRKQQQQTIIGNRAFNPVIDCGVCKAEFEKINIPHDAHDERCKRNRKLKGMSKEAAKAARAAAALAKYFQTPLADSEKGDGRHTVQDGVNFFSATATPINATTTTTTPTNLFAETTPKNGTEKTINPLDGDLVCSLVRERLENQASQSLIGAPLPMLALADVLSSTVLGKNKSSHFDGMCYTVPATCTNSAQYHSIVGKKLYVVDWLRFFPELGGLSCPNCTGSLKSYRTNYSKNKNLFPIFTMDGAPDWAIVMSYRCQGTCGALVPGNDGRLLSTIPEYAALAYPVEPRYAAGNVHSHLARSATTLMDEIMLTYTNGELCSRLIYKSINKDYNDRLLSYLSWCKKTNKKPEKYPTLDGGFLVRFPPTGQSIRDTFTASQLSCNNAWGFSEKERHVREIQAVKCEKIFAHDHTFEVTKNYQKKIGAVAVWDVASETGEIATAVLVRDTTTKEFAHAAEQLVRRTDFKPGAMYTDTWPAKIDFWGILVPSVKGRLGLFHFLQRIFRTLRHTHTDFNAAATDLLNTVYTYHEQDMEGLLTALKEGTLPANRKKMTEKEIGEMQETKLFRKRYGTYLRKRIREPNTLIVGLDNWFVKYKVTETEGQRIAQGRLCPRTKQTLFMSETKLAVEMCKTHAGDLQDPLDITEMYREIKPKPNSKHQLSIWISLRGESALESFHDNLANYANNGMNNNLADILNLMGTARYNLAIRHKLRIADKRQEERQTGMPVAWETVVPHWNHTELNHINQLATSLHLDPPFTDVEALPPDNGERFFSEYLPIRRAIVASVSEHPLNDRCQCQKCGLNTIRIVGDTSIIQLPPTPIARRKPPPPSVTVTRPTAAPAAPQRQPTVYQSPPRPQPMQQQLYLPPPAFMFQQQPYQHSWQPPQPRTQQQFCCNGVAHWSLHRRGRPPHDIGCLKRSGNI
jgi:hypothetical protein